VGFINELPPLIETTTLAVDSGYYSNSFALVMDGVTNHGFRVSADYLTFDIYCDSSVIGGYFDSEFEADSRRFIDTVRSGRIVMLVSEVVVQEILHAPENVQNLLASIPPTSVQRVPLSKEVIELRTAYIAEGILGAKWIDDATHVAGQRSPGLMPSFHGTLHISYDWIR